MTVMDDLISRQAVKDWLLKWKGYIDEDTIARMQYRVIDIRPAEVYPANPKKAEPVRLCRECKWSRYHINVDKHGKSDIYWWCLNWDGGTDEEGYCYEWEEKMEEDDE